MTEVAKHRRTGSGEGGKKSGSGFSGWQSSPLLTKLGCGRRAGGGWTKGGLKTSQTILKTPRQSRTPKIHRNSRCENDDALLGIIKR